MLLVEHTIVEVNWPHDADELLRLLRLSFLLTPRPNSRSWKDGRRQADGMRGGRGRRFQPLWLVDWTHWPRDVSSFRAIAFLYLFAYTPWPRSARKDQLIKVQSGSPDRRQGVRSHTKVNALRQSSYRKRGHGAVDWVQLTLLFIRGRTIT